MTDKYGFTDEEAGRLVRMTESLGSLNTSLGHYDKDGEPITAALWAVLASRDDYRRVAFDDVSTGISVSTVWLGLDHSFGEGPPLIFETMVFVALDEPRELFGLEVSSEGTETYRWTSLVQARAGHERLVAELRAQLAPEAPRPG